VDTLEKKKLFNQCRQRQPTPSQINSEYLGQLRDFNLRECQE
jgi:hypothetical protein